MPSASTKIEKQSPINGEQPISQLLKVLEKKVRNLEKRKGKLDAYKEDKKKGQSLNEDQISAVSKYDEVLQMLEFAKEMQKTAMQCQQETNKISKKLARREHIERQQQEIARLKDILLLQDLLNNMGTETVRDDFTEGNNGAIQLSPKTLDQLDELYKLVSSSREDNEDESVSHDQQLAAASEHLVFLLDGKDKEVLNTTYKELKGVLMSIHECKYFDKSAEEPVAEEEEEVAPNTDNDEVQAEAVPQNAEPAVEVVQDNSVHPNQFNAETQPKQIPKATDPKFNFLQDSQIDLESPHMDPAVVIAHPMAPAPAAGSGFAQNDRVFHPNDSLASSGEQKMRTGAGTEPRDDFNPSQPIPSQTFTNQNFDAFNIHNIHNQSVILPGQENQTNGPPPPIPMPNLQQSSNTDQPNSFASAATGHMTFNNTAVDTFESADINNGDPNQNNESSTGFNNHYNRGFNNRSNKPQRGGPRGAGGNGAYRGRSAGYQNGKGGGYPGSNRDNYYQSNNGNNGGQNGNFRHNRGAPRGAGGMRGNRGGHNRGNSRPSYNRDQ